MAAKGKSGFRDVPSRVHVDELEREVLKFWEKDKTFEKSLKKRKQAKLFTFYDGPPYATGKPHYGHVLQSAIKDAVLRYKTMRGYYVPRIVGWDTHGLPVEVFVEKELGFKNRKDIEAYGIEKFNQKCRETVFRYIDLWVDTLKRLGRWADYEHGYATLDRDYMESEWWVFKQLWDKGLVYKDFRSTPYCIRCGTPLSNYEAGEGYKDKTDIAVYVRLRVSPTSLPEELRGANQKLSLLVWTTTPWTLPANVAVAYNPDIAYVIAELDGEHYLLAKERVEAVLGSEATVIKDWSPTDFKDIAYEPMYPKVATGLSVDLKRFGLVEGPHVTADEGTGLVHMAPAFGAEDQQVAKQNDLPVVRNVDVNGVYTDGPWKGEHIWKANPFIVEDLEKRGLLFKKEQYTHSYPHCWRCDQSLIYYALDTWFVKVADLKKHMLAANEHINWIPEHIKYGRFAQGIEMAPDWAVSRNRFWSVPLPIWECDTCGAQVCVGSTKELQELSGVSDKDLEDLHRPYVDEITWEHSCKPDSTRGVESGVMRRIPEVLDVWFDSGSMPYAQWHYPFENKEFVEEGFPADFIVESIEMTRAWFYFLHVLSVAVKDSPAYKNVIGSGIIFGSDGNKLSKKLKNYPEPEPTIATYGADTVRMFFLSSTFGEPYVFSEKELQELHRNFTMRLWNVYSFFVQYANVADWKPATTPGEEASSTPGVESVLDRWILARLKQLEYDVISASDAYRMDNAARAFVPFVDDLSNWYVRRSRERFHPSTRAARSGQDPDSEAAFKTLHDVLVRLATLLAPFMPFVSEEIYRNIVGDDSVHLQDLPDAQPVTEEERLLLSEMARARVVVSQGLALRAKAGIKVRQPLSEMIVSGNEISAEITEIVQDEVNVKAVRFGVPLPPESPKYALRGAESGEFQVALASEVTPGLRLEGMARDIIRQGQVLRKKAGYKLDDKVYLVLLGGSTQIEQMLFARQDEIMRALQAKELHREKVSDEDAGENVILEGESIHLGVKKVSS